MYRKEFKGIFPALLTPFDENNRIMVDSMRRLIDYCLGEGVDGFYVGGSTGESFLLTVDERKMLLKEAIEACKDRTTVICQVGAISTDTAVELAQWSEKHGAHAVSAVAPFYYHFTKQQVIEHYRRITDSVSLPMIIYNIPGMSGVNLSEDDFKALYKHDRIIGVKHTHHNLYEMERIKAIDPNRLIYFGFDEVSLAGMAMGADGAIGSTFNFMPREYIRMKELYISGNVHEALEHQHRINDIISIFLSMGIFAALKYAISTRIGIPMGKVRAPFTELKDSDKKTIDDVLDRYGL